MEHHTQGIGSASSWVARSWWLLLLFGVLAVAFGVIAIFNPVAAGASITWAIGLLAIAEGVVCLLAVVRKSHPLPTAWALLYALLSLAFGIMAVLRPVSMAASLVMVTGVWVLLAGLVRLVMALRVRKHIRNEWSLILSAILAMVLGALMLLTPIAGLIMAVVWMGVATLFYGLLQIFAAFRLRTMR